jgi:hypothetical protein
MAMNIIARRCPRPPKAPARFNRNPHRELTAALNSNAVHWKVVLPVAFICILAVTCLIATLKRNLPLRTPTVCEKGPSRARPLLSVHNQRPIIEPPQRSGEGPASRTPFPAQRVGSESSDPPASAVRQQTALRSEATSACEPCDSDNPQSQDFHQTRVAFLRDPASASRIALRDGRLRFHLHISGNLEEARFT